MRNLPMFFAHVRSTMTMDYFLPRRSEWVCAGVMLLLGIMLIYNHDLMQPDSQGYRLMLSMAGQQTWALILMATGLGRLATLLVNGFWTRSPFARAGWAYFNCFFWTQIMLSFAPVGGFGVVLAAGFLVQDAINCVGAMRDARYAGAAVKRATGELGGSE